AKPTPTPTTPTRTARASTTDRIPGSLLRRTMRPPSVVCGRVCQRNDQAAVILAETPSPEKAGPSSFRNARAAAGRERAGIVNQGGRAGADAAKQQDQGQARHGQYRQNAEGVEEGQEGRLPHERPVEEAERRGVGGHPDPRRQVGARVAEPAL